jgi:hypothetical protein
MFAEDQVLDKKINYAIEKQFKELFGLMARSDLFIRETPSNTFTISVPHPSEETEYVLATYTNRKAAREFVDLGRCVVFALSLGATSINFQLAAGAGKVK